MEKEFRLTKRSDFNKIYRHGKSMANRQFVAYYMPQTTITHYRLGISVSKKVGNAVVRNRLRRMMKEIIRLNANQIKKQTDLILIARNPAATMNYAEMEKSILHVLRKANLFMKNSVVSTS